MPQGMPMNGMSADPGMMAQQMTQMAQSMGGNQAGENVDAADGGKLISVGNNPEGLNVGQQGLNLGNEQINGFNGGSKRRRRRRSKKARRVSKRKGRRNMSKKKKSRSRKN